MLDKFDNQLRFQHEALQLLSQRQDIIAANIANADTPGYLARDIDFSQQLKDANDRLGVGKMGNVKLAMTSGKHIPGASSVLENSQLLYRVPDQPSADGNTVDMDRERVNFADNTVKYQTSLTILGSQLKGMMTVISQG